MADSTLPPDSPSSPDDQLDPDLERRLATLALLPVPSRPDLRAPIDGMVGADLADAPVHPIDLDADPNGVRPLPTVRLRRRVLVGLAAAVVLVIAGAALLALDRGDGSTIAGPAPAGTLADPDRPLVGTLWELESVVDGSLSTSAEPLGPHRRRATLSFTVDSSASAIVVAGNDGCNDFGGTAVVLDSTISFGSMGHEDMACQGDEPVVAEALFQVLVGETTYSLDDGLLTITRDDRSLTFRPVTER